MVKTKREIQLEKENQKLVNENYEYWNKLLDAWDFPKKVAYVFIVIITTSLAVLVLLGVFGVFKLPIDNLNIDKDKLAEDYVLDYYPEYNNCSMIYDDHYCIRFDGIRGECMEVVKVYCGLDNRDGLSIKNEYEPSEIIYFEDITLEEIFVNKINSVI